jgi:predicted transposase/invertase (TIGR01784 family)
MTAAQRLRQEGMRKGIQKGRQEGMYTKTLDIAKNMLSRLHLDRKTVSEATGLSEEELIQLQEQPDQ